MPTTHFHVVPALPFLLFVRCLSLQKEIHCVWVEARERVTAFLSLHYLRSCRVCFFPLLANSSKSKAQYNLEREEERENVTCVARGGL